MRILHTSDWHIGKRLGRHDRMDEFRDVLAEVEAIADERDVDLVVVSTPPRTHAGWARQALAAGSGMERLTALAALSQRL